MLLSLSRDGQLTIQPMQWPPATPMNYPSVQIPECHLTASWDIPFSTCLIRPDFIKTIKQIGARLDKMAEVNESDEPLIEGNVYSRWRKSVIEAGKPVSFCCFFLLFLVWM